MRKVTACAIGLVLVLRVSAQLGATFVPYFWSTSFRSDMYDRTNGYGNVPFGFNTVWNYNNKFFVDFTTFRMLGEKKETFSDNYGYGVPNGTTHRNFRWTELRVDYSLFGKKWKDMDKWAPAFAFRGGVIFNSRMTMLAPQVGHDTVYTTTPPYSVDSVVSFNRFDLTGLKQTLLSAGFSIKIMHNKTVHMDSGTGTWYKNLATGEIFFVPDGGGGRDEYYRVRQWDIYADFLFAPVSKYGDYQGWDDYKHSTRSISGSDIPGKENIGWRWGVRHMAYNILGLQWVVEYMQLPGQKTFPNVEDLDEPQRKNRYFLIGLNFTFGFSTEIN